MNLLQIIVLLIIAGICGAVAELIVGFSPGGFLVSIVIGVIGAYLGGLLANLTGWRVSPLVLTIGGRPLDLLWAVGGSIVLLLVISLLRGRGLRGPRLRRRQ